MPKPTKQTKLTRSQATAKARAARSVPEGILPASGTIHLSAQDLKIFDAMKPAQRGAVFLAGLKACHGIVLDSAAADRLAALVKRLIEEDSQSAVRLECRANWESLKSALGPALVSELLGRETI